MNTLTPFIHHNMDNLPNETHGRADGGESSEAWAHNCLPSRQKNARSFLKGETPGIQQSSAPEISPNQSCQEEDETVQRLLEWREEAPYG